MLSRTWNACHPALNPGCPPLTYCSSSVPVNSLRASESAGVRPWDRKEEEMPAATLRGTTQLLFTSVFRGSSLQTHQQHIPGCRWLLSWVVGMRQPLQYHQRVCQVTMMRYQCTLAPACSPGLPSSMPSSDIKQLQAPLHASNRSSPHLLLAAPATGASAPAVLPPAAGAAPLVPMGAAPLAAVGFLGAAAAAAGVCRRCLLCALFGITP